MFLVSLLAIIITDKRTLTPQLCVAVAELTLPYSCWGCEELLALVFYKLLPPKRRTTYSVID